MRRWDGDVVLPLAFTAAIALAFAVIVFAGTRVSYGPGSTVVLTPTADSTLTGTWVVTEGTDAYDELDEAAAADGTGLSDGDTSAATNTTGPVGRALFDMSNEASLYGAANTRINWVSVAIYAKHSTSSAYTGDQTVGIRVAGADYLVLDMANTSGVAYTEYNPDNVSVTRHYTNPATGVTWTSSDVDSIQAYIDNPGDVTPRDITYSWLGVIVNYSKVSSVSETGITSGADN